MEDGADVNVWAIQDEYKKAYSIYYNGDYRCTIEKNSDGWQVFTVWANGRVNEGLGKYIGAQINKTR